MSKHNVVVIGNGMVGHRFIEELLEKAEPDQFSLTVFVKNPVSPMIVSTCPPTFPITPLKNCRWFVKAITTNIRSICCWVNAPSPLTVMRSSSTPVPVARCITIR